MAQFLPTFEGPQPQDAISITFHEEEELDDTDIDPTLEKELAKTCYVFLVDRSGSMSGRAMDITKQALNRFIQSLPAQSIFQIISFGSSHEYMPNHANNFRDRYIEYNDENRSKVLG